MQVLVYSSAGVCVAYDILLDVSVGSKSYTVVALCHLRAGADAWHGGVGLMQEGMK